jgi:hypothetical protein
VLWTRGFLWVGIRVLVGMWWVGFWGPFLGMWFSLWRGGGKAQVGFIIRQVSQSEMILLWIDKKLDGDCKK